jgi:hypothetical protein
MCNKLIFAFAESRPPPLSQLFRLTDGKSLRESPTGMRDEHATDVQNFQFQTVDVSYEAYREKIANLKL